MQEFIHLFNIYSPSDVCKWHSYLFSMKHMNQKDKKEAYVHFVHISYKDCGRQKLFMTHKIYHNSILFSHRSGPLGRNYH